MAINTWDALTSKAIVKSSVQKTNVGANQQVGNWATTCSLSGTPVFNLTASAAVAVEGSGAGVMPVKGATSIKFPDAGSGENPFIVEASIANSLGGANGDCGMVHMLYDKLWHVNVPSLATLGTATITAPPSIAARVNNNYRNTMIVVEITAAIAIAATTIQVTYTNQDGVAGRTTGVSPSISAFGVARWVILPFQRDDYGVQAIESIIVGGAPAATGAVNVSIVKPVMFGICRESSAGRYDTLGCEICGTKLIGQECLLFSVLCPGTSTGQLDAQLNLVYG